MDADKLEGAQLNTAIAKAKGWGWGLSNWALAWIRPDGGAEFGLPDWASDLAAAIPLLLEMMAHRRPGELNLVCFCNGDGDSYDIDAWRGHAHFRVDTEAEIPAMIARAWLLWKEATGD